MAAHSQKSVTIQDVAKYAGVSIATVSRVLSNSSYPVSPEKRKTVLQTARAMHYTPNLFGRMLQSDRNTSIGVLVPTLQNPYFHQVVMGIENEASRHNFEVVISSSHRSVAQERDNIKSLLEKQVMGLIVISLDDSPATLTQYIDYGGRVALLEADYPLEGAICAKIDYREAGRTAAQYLADRGHRNIALITAPLTKLYRRDILAGVTACLASNRIAFGPGDCFVAEHEVESETGMYEFDMGKELMLRLLNRRARKYTAVIAANDITAFGVIQAVSQNRLTIPGDLSIISFDNIPYAAMVSPALTTVALPSASMGASACHFLINALEAPGQEVENISFSFPCYVEERQSVGAVGLPGAAFRP